MGAVSRRSFLGTTAALAAAGAASPLHSMAQQPAPHAAATDPALAEFSKLIRNPAHIKQVFDVTAIGEGRFLNNIKNSLNGLHVGFGIPADQIKIVAALHGPTNLMNYSDYVWEKYKVGEWLKITDPDTGQPAVRNIFFQSKTASGAVDATAPSSGNPMAAGSRYQDTSIQALQGRGVGFLSCRTATTEQSKVLAKRPGQTMSADEILSDLLAHTLPGVLVVPAMVGAIALLQTDGHYSYITIT